MWMTASGSRILLDTNVVIGIFRGDARLQGLIGEQRQLYLPSIALGELYYGALNSSDPDKHLAQVGKLLRHVEVVGVDSIAARAFGTIKRDLRLKGTPIPENDIWIAAIAKAGNFLVATDDAHFHKIPELQFVSF